MNKRKKNNSVCPQKQNPHINLYQMRVDAAAFRLQPEIIKPLNTDLSAR